MARAPRIASASSRVIGCPANPLADPAIADEVEDELVAAGLTVERIDLDGIAPQDVRAALEPAASW